MTKQEILEELKDVDDNAELFVCAEGVMSPIEEVEILEDSNRALIVSED